jgi:transcriptional regulator with XRE-family HTH domain
LLLAASFKKFMNFKPFVKLDHHGNQRLSAVFRVFSLLWLISLVMLNERIRALRLAKGLTLQQVGDVFGISRASVSNWEAGHAQPDPRKIERLAALFDTSVQFLLSGQDLPPLASPDISFAGVPFIPFDQINAANENIEKLCQRSKKFLPMSFGSASQRAFCTNFPVPIDPSSTKLIPPGAVVFLDPQLTLKNHGVLLGRAPEMQIDFFAIEVVNQSRKLHSLTNSSENSFSFEDIKIIGIATCYAIFSPLNIN